MLRLSMPSLGREEELAIREVLQSGFLVQGKKVAAFEESLQDYLNIPYAVAVNSGTSALHLALVALGVGPGDEVIVPDYTFPATINVVELIGARPVVVDIEPTTLNIDPRKIQKLLTRRTKAIMPVHLFGQSADLNPILTLCRTHKLRIVEDAACALGADYSGRPCGTIGDVGCFSFHPRKILTTGEGGVIVTRKKSVADRLRLLRNHGMLNRGGVVDFVCAGYNNRMTELQAALGIVQMQAIERIIRARRNIAWQYDRQLRSISWIKPPVTPTTNTHVYQAYVVEVDRSIDRDALMKHLRAQGIEVNFGTYALHRLSFYKKKYRLRASDFPVSAKAFGKTLALPMFEQLTGPQIDRVVSAIKRFR